MAEEGSRSRNPAGHAGLLDNLLALTSALAGFFQNRWALVALDSKAALAQLVADELNSREAGLGQANYQPAEAAVPDQQI